mmetsp:Transcript_20042/g.59735  ORF Transcript_20042/g.59735 Transcript_20042/m.59735 type:complete len:339 (-) Transcript_20042:726-1742(-)
MSASRPLPPLASSSDICFIMFMRFCAPPICCSMRGSMVLCSCCRTCWGLRCICLTICSSPPFISPLLPIFVTTLSNCLWHRSSICTSMGCVPDPRATRSMRDATGCDCLLRSTRPSSSSSVIESIMYMKRFSRLPPSSPSPPIWGSPGIMAMTFDRGPSFMTFSNCSYMSRSVNWPLENFSIISSFLSSPMVSLICFTRPVMSPMPSSRETKDRATKGSKSSKCSPLPRNRTGAPVAATAERAPPPLAWPSNFVMTTEPMSMASWNDWACSCTAWPCVASSTKTTLSGSTAARISCISSKRALSWRWRPEVSTIITSYFSLRNCSTPSCAMRTGSASV